MNMQDIPLYGFEINNALGNITELLSVDQVPPLSGPILAMCNTSESNTGGDSLGCYLHRHAATC